MDSDDVDEVEHASDGNDFVFANNTRKAILQSILDQPFAGTTVISERQTAALVVANAEYDTIDLTNKLVFWTDASQRGDRVGIAVCWKAQHFSRQWTSQAYALEGIFNSYEGEFFAIAEALKIANKMVRQQTAEEDTVSAVVIYSDAQQVIKKIRDFHIVNQERRDKWTRHVELARLKERARSLVDSGIPLTIQWVKGHQGVMGNDLADKLAGQAAKPDSDVETLVPSPMGYIHMSKQGKPLTQKEKTVDQTRKKTTQARKKTQQKRKSYPRVSTYQK